MLDAVYQTKGCAIAVNDEEILDAQKQLATIEGAEPFGPAERPMGGYLSLPPSFTAEQAATWVNKAQAYVATLPPKAKKK